MALQPPPAGGLSWLSHAGGAACLGHRVRARARARGILQVPPELSLTPSYSVANFYSGIRSGSITNEMMRTSILNCYTRFKTSMLHAGMEGFSSVRQEQVGRHLAPPHTASPAVAWP